MSRKILLLFLSIVLVSMSGCAGLALSPYAPSTRFEEGKETLVMRDLGLGRGTFPMGFCGGRGYMYQGRNVVGMELIDFRSSKRIQVQEGPYDTILNCSPDGRKVIYLDETKRRIDEDIEGPKVETLPGAYCCTGHTEYIHMYDTETGERTLVASIRGGGRFDALSPDGTKLLLGEKHRLSEKAAVPEWEGVWFTRKWKPYGATWLPDSSGVITYGEDYNNIICIERFGEGGSAMCFEQRYGTEGMKVDSHGRVYFLLRVPIPGFYEPEEPTSVRHLLQRCDLGKEDLSCEDIVEDYDVNSSYAVLPDGDIVFQDYEEDDCIRRMTPGSENSRCVINTNYKDKIYDGVSLIGMTPDERWLAFIRYNRLTKEDLGPSYRPDDPFIEDLFVIDLKGE